MSKKYLLPCRCGREIPVEATQAGERIRCQCGTELDVPTMLALARLQPAVEPREAPPTARRGWNLRHRLALIGGIICLVGLAGMGGTWLFGAKPINILRFSPRYALGYWEALRHGIATPPTPIETYNDSVRETYGRWLWLSGAVAILGLLVAATAWLVRNRWAPGLPEREGSEANG